MVAIGNGLQATHLNAKLESIIEPLGWSGRSVGRPLGLLLGEWVRADPTAMGRFLADAACGRPSSVQAILAPTDFQTGTRCGGDASILVQLCPLQGDGVEDSGLLTHLLLVFTRV